MHALMPDENSLKKSFPVFLFGRQYPVKYATLFGKMVVKMRDELYFA